MEQKMGITPIGVVVLGILASITKSDVFFLYQYDYLPPQTLYSFHAQPQHLTVIANLNGNPAYVLTNFTNNTQIRYILYSNSSSTISAQIRSFPLIPNFQKGSFIEFYPNRVVLYQSGLKSNLSSTAYTISSAGTKILQSCFGRFPNQSLILIVGNMSTNTSYYQLLLHQKNTAIARVSISLSTYNQFDKMIFKNGIVYMLFQSAIMIYSINTTNSTTKFTLIQSMNIANTTVNYTDISANISYFSYSVNNSITILETKNYTVVWSTSLLENVIGISVVKYYIFVGTVSKLYQIDYEAKATISSFDLNENKSFLIHYFEAGSTLTLFPQYPENYAIKNSYFYNEYYKNCTATACTCAPTYGISTNNSRCYKYHNVTTITGDGPSSANANETVTSNSIPITPDNSTSPPQKNQATSFDNMTNSSDEMNSFSQFENGIVPSPVPTFQKYSTPAVSVATDFIGKSMTFTSTRISPAFLAPFTVFLDDLWYYRYHRNTYPQIMQFLTQKVDLINELRLSPWLFNSIDEISTPLVCNQSNEKLYDYLNFTGSDPQNVYFFHSAEDTYKGNFIMNALFLLTMKFFHILFSKIAKRMKKNNQTENKNDSFLENIAKELKYNSRWWCILVAVLQTNMLKLTFNCFTQLIQPSNFEFVDKPNTLTTLLFLYMLMLYCLCFYPLIHKFVNFHGSRILLTRTHFRPSSFYFECLSIVFRNFVRSFFHSFFIMNYSSQIIALTVTDVLFLFLAIKMFRLFKYKILAIWSLSYSFVFVVLDLYFALLENTQIQCIANSDKQLITLIIILILIGSNVLTCLTLLFINLWVSFKSLFIHKKIRRENSQKTNEKLYGNLRHQNIIKGQVRLKRKQIKKAHKNTQIIKETINIHQQYNFSDHKKTISEIVNINIKNLQNQQNLFLRDEQCIKFQKKSGDGNLSVKLRIKKRSPIKKQFKILLPKRFQLMNKRENFRQTQESLQSQEQDKENENGIKKRFDHI